MGDDADHDAFDGLEALDDVALARIAYGRVADSPESRMLAQRAARILAGRRPAPDPTPSVVDEPVADGPDAADAPRASRVSVRVVIAAALAVAALIAVALVAIPREPPAFAVFERPATPRERVLDERLAGTGGQLFSGVRVLQSVVLTEPGELLELAAYRGGASPRTPPSERTVCLAVFAADRLWSRTCLPEPAFLSGGDISILESLQGAELRYGWGPGGTSSVQLTPTGPTDLVELTALGLPAVRDLVLAAEDGPSFLVRSLDVVTRPSGRPEAVLGPAELARVDETWILIGAVRRSPTPGGELEVCAIATRIGVASAPIDSRCVTASDFAATGLATPPADGLRPFVYLSTRGAPTARSSSRASPAHRE